MAQMTTASIDDLNDSDFAYIEPGGKVVDGKTEPRSLRHFPIHDAAHVRNALARLDQSPFGDRARAKVEAAAKRMGIGQEGKAFTELKAELMTTSRLDKWLSGDIPRRILVVPFGGPLPRKGAPLGVDLDGEWFDNGTDIFGTSAFLKSSRERMVDWHHDDDPAPTKTGGTQKMKGATLGHLVLDDEPEEDGIWADWWARAGERRRGLIAQLQRMDVPLFGSSQALYKKADADTGHIDVWPIIRHTITTSPQNTWAVVPSLKAVLTADLPLDEIGYVALKAAMLGLADNLADLRPTFPDEAADTFLDRAASDAAKAGRVLSMKNEADLAAAIEALAALVARMRGDSPIEEING